MSGKANNISTIAIIPAAGWGIRMGGDRPKQFLFLDDRPILAVTLSHFQECPAVDAIIIVTPEEEIEYCRKKIVEPYNLDKVIKIVKGGQRRQDSVRLGIEATGGKYELVLIHDGARPLIDSELIHRVLRAARHYRAVITALPAKETVKAVDKGGVVLKTYPRKEMWLVQTPQVFRYEDIHEAHQKALQENWEELTDDALLIERMGIPVHVVEGSEMNIKITTAYDLKLARFLLQAT